MLPTGDLVRVILVLSGDDTKVYSGGANPMVSSRRRKKKIYTNRLTGTEKDMQTGKKTDRQTRK